MSELSRRLASLPPRERQIAERVALEGLSLQQFAEFYGVDDEAAAQLAWSVFARLGPSDSKFEAFVDEWRSGTGSGVLTRLREAREGAKAALREVDAARAGSRWRSVEEWLRWAAIIIIVLLSAWFWRRDAERPPPERRVPAPSL